MGPSAATFMRSTAAPKVENETPRFLVKSDSAFLRTRAAISELQISELRDTQQRESERSRKWIMMSESKFRHKNFHQTHALKTRSFIRCNRFAAPVFCFCFVLFLGISLPRRCCCAFARNLPDLGNHPGLHQQTVADPMTNEFTWTQIVNWQSTAILHRIRGERWRQQRLHRKNSQLSISLNKLELRGT